ncbi:MAG TPA: MarR family transcriptional regulator [Bacteroidia bacterium]|jgi:MarR family transcriptional regulator for hemolysin|nr:MarR family transcriptional regulator [Bacteroidia bacterium]
MQLLFIDISISNKTHTFVYILIMKRATNVLFYTIDKAIKTYRQFAQEQLKKANIGITIDQWLVLNTIIEQPGISQAHIADYVFKNDASVTRIVEKLVEHKYLKKNVHESDGRMASLKVTIKGIDVIRKVNRVAVKYRATALDGLSKKDIELTEDTLLKIINNCKK